MESNLEETKKKAEINRNIVQYDDSGAVGMDRNLDPKKKTSCHAKFFKTKDMKTVRMSFQEFLKANELNKEWKKDLLDTHYDLGKDDFYLNTIHREQLVENKLEPWLHYDPNEDTEEPLTAFYKRRNETQNFTIKDDIVTDSLGPIEALKTVAPVMDCSASPTITPLTFTRTNFKLAHKPSDVKAKTSTNFYKAPLEKIDEHPEHFDPIAQQKEKGQAKRIAEIREVKNLAKSNSKLAMNTKFTFGDHKDQFEGTVEKTSYTWKTRAEIDQPQTVKDVSQLKIT